MNKKYFLIAGALLLLLLAWSFYKYNKPHTGTTGISADYTLTAADIFSSFQKDEAAANKKFLGKVVEVKGVISDMQSGTGNNSILLEASAEGGVNCSFSTGSGPFPRQLKKGNIVSIKGRCTGFLMDVNLVDCVVGE